MRGLMQPGRRQAMKRMACAGALGGSRIARAAAATRIVSVGGALTETLYALGAQAELVGVDTTSLYPAAAQQLPNVGYQRTLSAEGVLSLAPTMLVATEDAGPLAVLRQIEAAQVPLHVLDSGHSFEGLAARTQRLAELIGRASAGTRMVQDLRSDWQATRTRIEVLASKDATRTPRVLFLMGQAINQLRAAGAGTAADALIGYAGARNAFGAVRGYLPLSPEAAMAAAPDVIVTTEHALAAAGGIPNLLRSPGLSQTPAGRKQRVLAVDILMALGFGPRLPLAVRNLAEALHAAPIRR